jgi:hypothetical protein
VPHLLHQQTKDLLVGSNKMNMIAAYRVRFTNWKEGNNEYFFVNQEDAQAMINKYVVYGYKATLETIFLAESMVSA